LCSNIGVHQKTIIGAMKAKKPNIQDVARTARVSLSTVSAVLNDVDIVKEATRQRVLAAIRQLNYHPDLYASNLARRKTRTLGLIISDIVNPFFSETARSIEEQALACGYQVALAETGFSPQRLRECVGQMIAMRVAGLAVMTSETDPETIKLLRSQAVPTVFLDVGDVGATMSNLRVDTGGGMFQAVHHLLQLGHSKILFVKNSPRRLESELLSHRMRREGFTAALRKVRGDGVEGVVIDEPGDALNAGVNAMRQSLRKIPFTAVVAMNDSVAVGVCRGLFEASMKVPTDVSVVGFDNTGICEFLNPPLTTVDIPRRSLGRIVVSTLVNGAEKQAPGQELLLATQLIVRESTAAPVRRSRNNRPFKKE